MYGFLPSLTHSHAPTNVKGSYLEHLRPFFPKEIAFLFRDSGRPHPTGGMDEVVEIGDMKFRALSHTSEEFSIVRGYGDVGEVRDDARRYLGEGRHSVCATSRDLRLIELRVED